ncbi:hypothetical protein OAS39_04980 [Pirellulales bacterium]|nr:hypothetical protein [Pirellulales bacterium]
MRFSILFSSSWDIKQLHMAEQLSFMDGMYLFNGFYLDEQAFVDP